MTTLLTKLRSEIFEIDRAENTLYVWVKAIRENGEQPSPEFMDKMQDILLNGTNNSVHYMSRHRHVVRRLEQLLNENTNNIDVGGTGTRPAFFLPGQLVKIPGKASATGTGTSGYQVLRIDAVTDSLSKTAGGGSKECVAVEGVV